MKIALLLIVISISLYSQNNMNSDWPNLAKYATENQSHTPTNNSVVFIGDSITEFWKTNDPDFFTYNPFINRGISGQTTPQMLLRFRQDVINLKPKTVVLLAGINDIAQNTGPISIDQIFGNIISMIELAKINNITIVLCSVLPANNFNWNLKIKPANKIIELNLLLKNYAIANKIIYVDYYKKMVDIENGMQKKYSNDGVHPNFEGYKVMQLELLKNL